MIDLFFTFWSHVCGSLVSPRLVALQLDCERFVNKISGHVLFCEPPTFLEIHTVRFSRIHSFLCSIFCIHIFIGHS